MAPILRSSPSAQTFATTWTQKFEESITRAAGKDGRLSRTEALRLAERTDGAQLFSDTAVKLIDSFGARSASVGKLVEAGHDTALAAALRAAGADGKLSLKDADQLPKDLRDDFLYLRGKGPADKPQYTDAQLKAVVKRQVLAALDGGTLVKLSRAPASVRGRRPVLDDVPHPASNTRAIAYVAGNVIYISRASPVPSPLVGWYRVGTLPPA